MDPNQVDYVMGMDPDDFRSLGREVAQATAALEARRQERVASDSVRPEAQNTAALDVREQERKAFDTLSPEAQMAAQARMWHSRLGPRDAFDAQPTRQADADFNNGTHAEFQQNRSQETVVFPDGTKNA